MKLFNFNFNSKDKPENKETKETKTWMTPELNFGANDIIYLKETDSSNSRGYIDYQDRNYTRDLMGLLDLSAIHNRIIVTKANLTSGKEFMIDGKLYPEWVESAPLDQTVIFKSFVNNAFNDDWYQIKHKLATDLMISGNFYLEIIWKHDFSGILSVIYHPWMNVRPGEKNEDGEIEYFYYSQDFNKANYKIIKVQAFDINAHQPEGLTEAEVEEYGYSHHQILMVKNFWPGLEYFGRPSYFGGVRDIKTSGLISVYNENGIQSGFSSSLLAMLKKPQSFEEEQTTARNFVRQFTGPVGRKISLFFFESEEDRPVFQPLEVRNLSDQYNAAQENMNKSILTAHGVTAPEMFGISTPGRLGNAELDIAYSIFYNDVILEDKQRIERVFNLLISLNGFRGKVTFETKKPFEASEKNTSIE